MTDLTPEKALDKIRAERDALASLCGQPVPTDDDPMSQGAWEARRQTVAALDAILARVTPTETGALNAVVALHIPGAETWWQASWNEPLILLDTDLERCKSCREDYPCATIRAINGKVVGK